MPFTATDFQVDAPTATARGWRWVAASAIVGNLAVTYYSRLHPFNGASMGYVSGKYPTLLTPAGYAFSIWGLIFLALGVYAVWQLLPAQRRHPLPDAVVRPLTVANGASALWVVAFAYEHLNFCALLMVLLLLALIAAYGRARWLVLHGAAPRWVSAPFALFLGWISVATVVNLSISLRLLLGEPATNVAVLLTLLLLVIIVGIGLLISWDFHEMVYPLVIAWALVGIWVAHRSTYPELGWAALLGAALVAVGGITLAWWADIVNGQNESYVRPGH